MILIEASGGLHGESNIWPVLGGWLGLRQVEIGAVISS